MYKAAIFDLDGTLLNTLDDLAASVNHALKKHGMSERTLDEVRAFVGNGVRRLIERSVTCGTDENETEAVLADFKEHYGEHCRDMTAPYPGITEMLCNLKKAGVRTAVVSNKIDSATKKLCREYFDGLILSAVGDVEGRAKKPAPDAVFAALAEIGTTAEESVYIGDSDVDVLTAANSSMGCIAVTWGFRSKEVLLEAGAKTFADTVGELERLILE